MSSLQQMLMRSKNDQGAPDMAPLLSAYEAEQLVEQLHVSPIEQVGGAKFMKQNDAIQKLNLQAHHNAQLHSDEFVLELLVSRDKLSVLVQELLVIEAWKQHLLPLLQQHLADHVDSATTYLLLYHEAAVANLLEVVLYHQHACEAVGEDALLELADWAMRKLAHLNSDAHKHTSNKPERSVKDCLSQTDLEELEDKQAETDFSAALCGLTILRYLTDHITRLPLGLMGRLLSANDAVMALLPLVESPPWVRCRAGGKTEKFIGGRWQQVAPTDRLKITQLDGQVWLSLVNLLVEPACRAKYDPDDFRKSCLLKLQRHLHELMLDQLPVLRQLARVLDELALGIDSSRSAAGAGGRLILEQVPLLREALLSGKDWPAIAQQQRRQQFGPAGKQLAKERLESMLQSFEMMCRIEEQQQQQQATGGKAAGSSPAPSLADGAAADEAAVLAAPVRVTCSRQVHTGGMWEHWCEFTATIDASKAAEVVTISSEQPAAAALTSNSGGGTTKSSSCQAPAGASSNSNSSGGTSKRSSSSSESCSVSGRRYRLAAMDMESSRALPVKGKIAVHFMGSVAEALLQLPEVPLRGCSADDAAAAPPALWLTVGLLAADSFALQIRLRKADKPQERDRALGSWYAYHPVGGAITVILPASKTTAGASSGAPGKAACSKISMLDTGTKLLRDVECLKP